MKAAVLVRTRGMDDTSALEQQLSDARPEPSPDALDRVETRLSRVRARRARRRSSTLMTALLAVGILATGSGGALAVSGLSAEGTAAQAEYPVVSSPSSDQDDESTAPTLGETKAETESSDEGGGEQRPVADVAEDSAQANQQAAAAGASDGLPLTGYLAVPVLLLGIVSLGAGLVLRRRTGRSIT